MKELTDLSVKPENSCIHACGHDMPTLLAEISISTLLTGREDFRKISYPIPTRTVLLVASDENINLHNPASVFDGSVLTEGVKVYIEVAMSWLQQNK